MEIKCFHIYYLAEQGPMCDKHLINISYCCCRCYNVAQEAAGAQEHPSQTGMGGKGRCFRGSSASADF